MMERCRACFKCSSSTHSVCLAVGKRNGVKAFSEPPLPRPAQTLIGPQKTATAKAGPCYYCDVCVRGHSCETTIWEARAKRSTFVSTFKEKALWQRKGKERIQTERCVTIQRRGRPSERLCACVCVCVCTVGTRLCPVSPSLHTHTPMRGRTCFGAVSFARTDLFSAASLFPSRQSRL